ncbi:MAG: hypothetical protein NC911_03940 [Candidatus Omnitrophica bacterium]|nr:hypothetical protein [Candidatus Omnitrophota bacterium]
MVILRMIFLLVFGLGISTQAADRGVLAPIARSTFEKKVVPLFEGRLSVGDFEVSLPRKTLTVTNIVLLTPPGFGRQPIFEVARIKLKVAPLPLLKHQFVVKEVVISEPVITCYQRQDGRVNLAAELMRLVKKKPETTETAVSLTIDQVVVENGEFRFWGPLPDRSVQQIFSLSSFQAELSRVMMPNPHSVPSPFFLKGRLVSAHQGMVSSRGEVSLGVTPVCFKADAEIQGLFLEDFVPLFPQALVTPVAGYADIRSHFECWGTYLENINQVEITGLRLRSQGGLAGKFFLGLPAAAVAAILADENSTINLSFVVRGPFEDLKVDLWTPIKTALQKQFQEKFSSRVAGVIPALKKKATGIFRRGKVE